MRMYIGCMRRKRIKRARLAYYHCMTRVVGRQMLLGSSEKEHMRVLIRKVEGFTGVQVLTYALMTNHIHLLLKEPERDTVVDEDVLVERMRSLYSEEEMEEVLLRWADWRAQGNRIAVEEDMMRYRRRMHDISEFMKTLKHRFSFWYNRRNDRKGTLWSERFKSVLVEGGDALRTVAGYIEMNPVRAGLACDPSGYLFCGLGDAAAGSVKAREGIMELVVQKNTSFGTHVGKSWCVLSAAYFDDVLMYGGTCPAMHDASMKDGGGCLQIQEAELLYRNRFFSDGQVIGSKSFVEEFFAENRDYFGSRRTSGGRRVKGITRGLYAIRDVGRIVDKRNKQLS
ncbi:MAG: hypothetical protein EOL87_00095 [Spartobacteria bacterium]|nr:hypothetical protein [Spartobacteria bacterium]